MVSVLPALLIVLAAPQEPPWALPPIEYGTRPTSDRVAQLAAQVKAGERSLATDGEGRLLLSLLEALEVPVTSQMTVFSRTSFQADLISNRHPRALYFSDEVYVGFVPDSKVYELTAVDPREGLVFYTLTQGEQGPQFQRETDRCLQCHAPTHNGQLPSNLVRSVHPSPDGLPLLRAGSRFVDHATPYAQRWGGWYVTGDSGSMTHMGNQRLLEGQEQLAPASGAPSTLENLCDATPYPASTSDVVALLVFEHQTAVHDALTWAGYEARRALHYQVALNRDLGLPADTPVNSTDVRLDAAAKRVVRALLLVGEPPLPNPVGADSAYAAEFQTHGLRDSRGRSLRDLDLKHRLFRHPLSYLIYSEAFTGLPDRLRSRIWLRLWLVLNGVLEGADDPRLARSDRVAIREILTQTWAGDLPSYW